MVKTNQPQAAPRTDLPPAARPQDMWGDEREGYSGDIPVAYAPVRQPAPPPRQRRWVRAEERLGSLIAGGGIIWTTQAVTSHYEGLTRVGIMPPGPLEVCAIGILVWLHAKWRKSLRLN